MNNKVSNFDMLNEAEYIFLPKNYNDEIIKYIKELENKIDNEKYDNFNIVAGKILEIILKCQLQKNAKFDLINYNLDKLIKCFFEDKEQHKEQHNSDSFLIKSAMYNIKDLRNREAHSDNHNVERIAFDRHTCLFTLQYIHILLIFFIRKIHNININDFYAKKEYKKYQWDSKIYEQKKIITNKRDSNLPQLDYIKTESKCIYELLKTDCDFYIPSFQRNYTWGTNNIKLLLEDIEKRSNDKNFHFIGTLIISKDNKHLRIIDGQQRITTILLIAKAIIEKMKEQQKYLDDASKLESWLKNKYINKGLESELNVVQSILEKGNKYSQKDKQIKSNSYNNWEYIQKYFRKISNDDFEKFQDTFFWKLVYSEIFFEYDLSKEILIFEKLNSSSVPLTVWDIIKNAIYIKIDNDFLKEQEIEIVSHLRKIFTDRPLKQLKSLMEKKNKTYNDVLNKEISNFFNIYCRIKKAIIKKEDMEVSVKKIHNAFNSIWKNEKINNMETLKKSLSEISNYFYIYSCIRGKEYLEKGNFLYKYKLYLENLDEKEAHYSLFINLINESCEWNDSIDGLMIPTIKFENQKLLLDFFKLVEKYLIRLHVSKGTGISTGSFFDSFISNDIKDSYNKLYEEIKNMTQNHIFGFSPLNDFAQKLKSNSLPPTAAKSMIRKIAHLDGKNYDYNSLEHIIPKENKLWKDFFKSKKIENEESFNKKSEENVDKLGNLLIIDSESNTKASNKLFEEKIKIYPSCYLVNGKKENSCEELMNLLEKNNFCFDDVIKRTEQLVKILVTENYYKFDFEDDYCDCESNEESSFLYN